jgi:taurine transport system substrate-binding protein
MSISSRNGNVGMFGRMAAACVALSLALGGVVGCGDGGDDGGEPAEVVMAYVAIPGQDVIVKHQGWLEDALDANVKWRPFETGADVSRAVGSGNADIGYLGSTPAAAGLNSGLPYKVAFIYSLITAAEGLAAQPEEGVEAVSDLAGKKVATPFGSTAHDSLLSALQEADVDESSVEIVDLPPEDLVAAWKRGDISAAYIWEPFLGQLSQDGGRVLTDSGELADAGKPTLNVGIVNSEFADQYPDAVSEWVRQEDRATDLIRSDKSEAVSLITDELDLSGGLAKAGLGGLTYLPAERQLDARFFGSSDEPGDLVDALSATGENLASAGLSPTAADEAAFMDAVDPRFLESATGTP